MNLRHAALNVDQRKQIANHLARTTHPKSNTKQVSVSDLKGTNQLKTLYDGEKEQDPNDMVGTELTMRLFFFKESPDTERFYQKKYKNGMVSTETEE